MSGNAFEDWAEVADSVAADFAASAEQPDTDAEESNESTGALEDAGEASDTAAEQTEDAPSALHWEQVLAGEIDWTGIDRAPIEKLPPLLANLKRAHSRELQKAAEERRRWEEANAAMQRDSQVPKRDVPQTPTDDPEPPFPTAQDDDQAYMAKHAAWTRWNARQETRVALQKVEEAKAQFAQQQQAAQAQAFENYVASNLERVGQRPGYSDEVGQTMLMLVEENNHWRSDMRTPDGFDRLFDYAKYLHDTRKAKAVASDRAATSATRTLPRPSTRTTAPAAAPAQKATDWDDIAAELAQDERFRGLDL